MYLLYCIFACLINLNKNNNISERQSELQYHYIYPGFFIHMNQTNPDYNLLTMLKIGSLPFRLNRFNHGGKRTLDHKKKFRITSPWLLVSQYNSYCRDESSSLSYPAQPTRSAGCRINLG